MKPEGFDPKCDIYVRESLYNAVSYNEVIDPDLNFVCVAHTYLLSATFRPSNPSDILEIIFTSFFSVFLLPLGFGDVFKHNGINMLSNRPTCRFPLLVLQMHPRRPI